MKQGKAFEKRIRFGAYMPVSHPDERHVRELAEAGVDFAVKKSRIFEGERAWSESMGI